MQETVAVANAHGVGMEAGVAEEWCQMIAGTPPSMTCSTHKDVAAGKPSEVDGLSGAVIRLAKAATPPVPTPTHALAWALLLPGEKRARGELVY